MVVHPGDMEFMLQVHPWFLLYIFGCRISFFFFFFGRLQSFLWMVVQQLVVILVCFVVYVDWSVVCSTLLSGLHFSQFGHSVMSDSLQPHGLKHARLPCPLSTPLHKLIPIKSVMPSNHLILCHPLLLPPSIFPSIRVFSDESVLQIRWPKYWSFSFNISPSNEYSRLISFKMDWLDLLAIQWTLKHLLPTPHLKSISSSVLNFLCSPTFTSIHDYWKNHSFD